MPNSLQEQLHKTQVMNQFLKEKNEILKATVQANKEVLSVALEDHKDKKDLDARIIVEKLVKMKTELELINAKLSKETAIMRQEVEHTKNCQEAYSEKCIGMRRVKVSQEIDDLENENFILTNLIDKKDHIIAGLERKIKDSQKNKPDIVVEKKIADPAQQTLIMHNELQGSRLAFKKLTKNINAEINKNEKIIKSNKSIKEQNEFLINVIRNLRENTEKATDNCI